MKHDIETPDEQTFAIDTTPRPRRPLQFSLQRLFLAVTCFAVAAFGFSLWRDNVNHRPWDRVADYKLSLAFLLVEMSLAGGIGAIVGKFRRYLVGAILVPVALVCVAVMVGILEWAGVSFMNWISS